MHRSTRSIIIICVSIALILGASCVQGALTSKPGTAAKPKISPAPKAPAFVLPVGSTVLTEVNLSESNILNMFKQAIPSFTAGAANAQGGFGEMLQKLNLEQLYEAIKQVKAVRVVIFNAEAQRDTNNLLNFFENQATSSKGWDRIFYSSQINKNGALAVYIRKNEFLGVMLSPKQNITFGTVGFIDVAKLFGFAGNAVSTFGGVARHEAPVPEVDSETQSQPDPTPAVSETNTDADQCQSEPCQNPTDQ